MKAYLKPHLKMLLVKTLNLKQAFFFPFFKKEDYALIHNFFSLISFLKWLSLE